MAISAKQLPPSVDLVVAVNLDRSLITAREGGVSVVFKSDITARKKILVETLLRKVEALTLFYKNLMKDMNESLSWVTQDEGTEGCLEVQ